jgi:lipopolysaccharide export system permease protein
MKIVDRYIQNALLIGIFATMAVLLPLIGFWLLADELDEIGAGNYNLQDAFLVVTLSLPRYAHQIFPIGTLIGSLLGLGNLANHGELNAMRAVGISITRIIWAVIKTGMIIAICAVLIGELLAPFSEEIASNLRANFLADNSVTKTLYGFWARDRNTFVNIRDIMPEGRLGEVYIYEFNQDRQLIRSTNAALATYDTNAKTWQLEHVQRSIVQDTGVATEQIPKMTWSSLINPEMLNLLVINPESLPIWTLYRYMQFMAANGLNITNYQIIFWNKLANPIVILMMITLTVPLLFGNLRQVSTGQRVFSGIMLGIMFYIISTITSRLAVAIELNPILAAFAPSLLCLIGVAVIARRV